MTTSVKVTAHCSSEKQVRISKWQTGGEQKAPDVLLQDGESNEQVVYDDWSITVNEESKSK